MTQRWAGSAIFFALPLLSFMSPAQTVAPSVSKVWIADQGNGTYRNPVLFADYSDPDVLRVGDDFYLVASSFDQVPGLPILHSRDLVNWQLIAHALPVQPPADVYTRTSHGNGVWAPSLRRHAGRFFIYYPDPEFGIYVTTATTITGPWTEPRLIKAAKGWIDPCPFWDDDGHAYLINGVAASRSGLKNLLILSRMSDDGEHLLDEGTLIIDGHGTDITLEGPKLYKRNGWFYVFAPAGGVPTGHQLVFRSRSLYGPYERKVVLAQGKTAINGPHQGAWVDTAAGEDWFLHFQDRGPYGRLVLLEPMRWKDDWPVIGTEPNTAGVGEPVLQFRKPRVAAAGPVATPPDSDEFGGSGLGLQWQWQANPQPGWALPFPAAGVLRLRNVPSGTQKTERLWDTPNVLLTKLPAPTFHWTVKLRLSQLRTGDRAGVVLLGRSYVYLAVRQTESGASLVRGLCSDADKGGSEAETPLTSFTGDTVFLRMALSEGAKSDAATAQLSYSTDGVNYQPGGASFSVREGVWIGAKLGLFAQSASAAGETGFIDVDWARFEPGDSTLPR